MTNGEKYKTAKEREDAYTEFRNKTRSEIGRFAWLDLEAEEEKPMPCPFCASDCSVIDNGGDLFVQCSNDDCQYSGKLTTTKDAAIAAHNRVCKAVDAYNESEVK